MSENVIVVNTHPVENPEFVGKLVSFINSIGIKPEIVEGYKDINPLDRNPSCIILTGVPMSANYSLSDTDTQIYVERAFSWLRECKCPVLGICYGHQILAQIFGGEVSSLKVMVKDQKLSLTLKTEIKSGIFSGVGSLEVFAEHQDYVSKIPEGFRVLCQIGEIPYIIYHPESQMYGVQFVPEQSDKRSQEILKQFIGK
jgi:GMP synthase-like glutamine amidotransferase